MASTYSALKIELIATGEQSGTWGATTNVNLGDSALGEAITGSADVAFSSADVTITLVDTNATQSARNLRLNLTGTSGGARNLILGSGCQIEKLYLINNGLADAVTVKNTTGTGIAVPAGTSMFVYNNGTNVVVATTAVTTLTNSALTSGRVTYAGTAGLLQDSANLTFNGTTLTANTIGAYTLSGTIAGGGNQINNVIIGTSTPLAGSFTTINASTSITNAGLTSGRVTYAGASGLLSDSANLTWDNFNVRLGIGTASPSYTLDVVSTSMRVASGTTGVGYVQYGNSATASNNWHAGTEGDGSYRFYNGNFGSGSLRTIITSAGNVGIGTSSPNQSLTLGGSAGTQALSFVTTAYLGDNALIGNIEFSTNSASGGYDNLANIQAYKTGTNTNSGDLTFWTKQGVSTEKMRITAAGNVGIGTSNPSQTLSVSQTALITSTAGGVSQLLFGDNASDFAGRLFYNHANDNLQIFVNSAEKMRITDTGNVGIGTSSPSAKLNVVGGVTFQNSTLEFGNVTTSANQYVLQYMASGNGYYSYMGVNGAGAGVIDITGVSDNAVYYGSRSNVPLQFLTNNTIRATFDTSGNLGIGTTSPTSKLHVQGTDVTGIYKASSTGVTYQIYQNNGGEFYVGRDDQAGGSFGKAYANILWGSGGVPTVFATGNSEKMRIDSSGNLLVGTTSQASSVSNIKNIVGGVINSFSNSLSSLNSGTAYTMFTMTADFATYIVTCSGLVSSAAYSETAIVHLNNTSVTVTIIADGSVCTISNSGLNIQYTQNSGGTMGTLIWSAMRIL